MNMRHSLTAMEERGYYDELGEMDIDAIRRLMAMSLAWIWHLACYSGGK